MSFGRGFSEGVGVALGMILGIIIIVAILVTIFFFLLKTGTLQEWGTNTLKKAVGLG